MSTMEARSDWTDYAKAIGILLVVYGHVSRGLISAGVLSGDNLYRIVDSVIYSFHMPLFFFLSGLFLLRSLHGRGGRGLLLNKTDTVVYPYILWSLVQGFIEVKASAYKNGAATYDQVFSLFSHPRAQFWFLYALFLIFVIAAVIYRKSNTTWLSLVVLAGLFFYVNPLGIQYEYHIGLIASNFVYFSVGVLFSASRGVDVLSGKSMFWLIFLASLALQIAFHGALAHSYEDVGLLSFCVALASMLAVVGLSLRLPAGLAFLSLVGQSSMKIYILHIFAAAGARIVLLKVFGLTSPSVHLLVGCLAGVFLPIALVNMLGARSRFLFSPPAFLSAQRLQPSRERRLAEG